jgi:predicted nuclease with TOPRIM domain
MDVDQAIHRRNEEKKKILKEKNRLKKKFKELETQIKKNEISKSQLYEWFKEEIERKDSEIEKLKKDNHVLFMTALRSREIMLSNNNDSNKSDFENTIDASKIKFNKS